MRTVAAVAVACVLTGGLFGWIALGAQQSRQSPQSLQGGGERSGPAQPPLFLPDDEEIST